MPNVTFLPSRDADLVQWCQNFSTRITASPTTFGLTSALCTSFSGLLSAFTSALAACAPDTRSKSNVTAKNAARDAVKINARLLANIINGQATVTDAQKQALGLKVRAVPKPIPAPTVAPGMTINGVTGRTVKVSIFDPTKVNKKGRPQGALGATVMSYVGENPPTDPSLYKFEGSTTKRDFEVQFPASVPAGATVYVCAFWFSPTAMSGPACTPQKATLQYGMGATTGLKMAA